MAEKISEIANKSEEVVNTVVESNPVTTFIRDVVTSPKFYVPVIAIVLAFVVIAIVKKYINKRVKTNASSITLKRRNTVYVLAGNIRFSADTKSVYAKNKFLNVFESDNIVWPIKLSPYINDITLP